LSASITRRFNPFLNNDLSVCNRLLVSCAVRDTTREFGHFGDKRAVFFAPMIDNFGFTHRLLSLLSQSKKYKSKQKKIRAVKL